MSRFKILGESERKELMKKLEKQYGIKEIEGTLITLGQEKIRLFTGEISEKELEHLGSIVHVEISGLYLLSVEKDGIRLSHDAPIILRHQIHKSIIEIDKKQEIEWLKGHDVLLTKEQEELNKENNGFVVIKSEGELIGCGKLGNDGRIRNFVPKERRLK